MEWDTFIQNLLTLLKNAKNLYFLFYAAGACLLTQIVKKVVVNKVKTEIFRKFNFATLLPFVFGLLFAVVNAVFVEKTTSWDFNACYGVFVEATAIGATATVIFRTASALSGKSLKTLKQDEVFNCFFTQLTYFQSVRERLEKGELSLADFVNEVKFVTENAKAVWSEDESTETKKLRLTKLVSSVFSVDDVSLLVDSLAKAMSTDQKS